jgi:branched-chain amino acid transport system substrate-binding protein
MVGRTKGKWGGSVRKSFMRVGIAVGVGTLMVSLLSVVGLVSQAGAAASAPGVTKSTIKIGILGDLTGPAASTFEDGPAAMEARFKQINAAGGVNGRKIV